MKPSVAILGAGAMGRNLARGLLDAGWSKESVILADRYEEVAREAQASTGIEATVDAAAAAAGRDVVVIAVKPNDVVSLLDAVASVLEADQVVVSFAAGVPLRVLERPIPGIPVVRTMPNTPAAVGMAMTAFCGGDHADARSLDRAEEVLSAVGKTLRVDEGDLDAVTAVSGSGPAYLFLLAEALEEAAVAVGLDSDAARLLVAQTLVGSSTLLDRSEDPPGKLRRDVTSPGGTTQAALEVFAEHSFGELVARAVAAAKQRSIELGNDAGS